MTDQEKREIISSCGYVITKEIKDRFYVLPSQVLDAHSSEMYVYRSTFYLNKFVVVIKDKIDSGLHARKYKDVYYKK